VLQVWVCVATRYASSVSLDLNPEPIDRGRIVPPPVNLLFLQEGIEVFDARILTDFRHPLQGTNVVQFLLFPGVVGGSVFITVG
jgi:hypothetical protein